MTDTEVKPALLGAYLGNDPPESIDGNLSSGAMIFTFSFDHEKRISDSYRANSRIQIIIDRIVRNGAELREWPGTVA